MIGRPWEFEYMPAQPLAVEDEMASDFVVATESRADPPRVVGALASIAGARVESILDRAPIHWTRVRTDAPLALDAAALALSSLGVRYVTPACAPSAKVGGRLVFEATDRARARGWRARSPAPRSSHAEVSIARSPGRWFLDDQGVAVDRDMTGEGAGTRLAVVDDDALEAESLGLDAEVLVAVDAPPRHHMHGSLLVGWAVGAEKTGFRGVAPAASPRLYSIPKPGRELFWLPVAIVRAVDDGADVVVCATYVEGMTTPMLDDALEHATRVGRRGRGALVVFPTGRETSSPRGSVHASLTLGFGEPASDPRAFCVGPSGRGGGWFIWRDKRGRSRPFANRGPAVRWLAPGDDLALPFLEPERLAHAESSGAAAVAAGVMLLVLGQNPTLRREEVERLLTASAEPVSPGPPDAPSPLADGQDVLPGARDRDGHNAKHGYGRLQAARACALASDPLAAALVSIGEDAAARAWTILRARDRAVKGAYSRRAGRLLARALIHDGSVSHGLRALVRHMRLVAGAPSRVDAHGPGVVARALAVLLRTVATQALVRRPPVAGREVGELADRVAGLTRDAAAAASFEADARSLAERVFRRGGDPS